MKISPFLLFLFLFCSSRLCNGFRFNFLLLLLLLCSYVSRWCFVHHSKFTAEKKLYIYVISSSFLQSNVEFVLYFNSDFCFNDGFFLRSEGKAYCVCLLLCVIPRNNI